MSASALAPKPGSVPARGTAQLLAARIAFVGIGFAVSVLLGRSLGKEAFGRYGVCLLLVTFLELAANSGLQAATGRALQDVRADARAVAATARWLHVLVCSALFVVVLAAAPWIARALELEDGAALVRLAALDLPVAGLYFAYQGIRNAERRFGTLALGFVAYALAKLVGVLVLLGLGASVEGALVVNVAATLGGVAWFAREKRRASPDRGRARASLPLARALVRLALPMGSYLVLSQALMSLDLWLLQAWGSGAEEVGRYNAALSIARALGVVPAALSGVVLASLARALAHGDTALARHHVRSGGRFALILLVPAAALIALHAEDIVGFVYGSQYAGSGTFLALLAALFALAGVLDAYVHALMAAGRARAVALLIGAGLPLAVLLAAWWIPRFGGRGAACASLVAVGLACVGAIALARARFGAALAPSTLARVLVATAAVGALGWWIPSQGLGLVLELGLLYAAYGGALLLLGEVRREELRGMLAW